MTPDPITPEELARQLRVIGPPGWAGAVPPPLAQAVATALAADIRRRFQTSTAPDGTPWRPLSRPRPNGGAKPLLDTGLLRNSVTARPEPDGASAGTNAVQAPLMNFGGVVRPAKGKFLAVPATREAKRAGSPRRFPTALSPRVGRRGGVLLDPRGRVQFYLTRQVTVPARPFLGLSADGFRAVEGLVADFVAGAWPVGVPGA